MEKPKLKYPSPKLLIIAGLGIIAIILLWYGLLYFRFSASILRNQTLAALSSQLGEEVTAIDLQQFSLMPYPKLVLNSVQVKNNPQSRYSNMLKSSSMMIQPSLASLFGDLVVDVTFYDSTIELETFNDKTHSWQRENGYTTQSPQALIQAIHIDNAVIHYQDVAAQRDVTIDKFYASLRFESAEQYRISGEFIAKRDRFEFALNTTQQGGLNAQINNQSSRYSLEGIWNADKTEFSGNHTLESADIGQLLAVFMTTAQETPQIATEDEDRAPITLKSPIIYQNNRLTFNDIEIDSPFVKGQAKALAFLNKKPEITLQLVLSELSLNPLTKRGIFQEFITNQSADTQNTSYRAIVPRDKQSSLPNDLKVTLSLTSEKGQFESFDARNIQMAAILNDGVISVAQFSGNIAEDNQFLVTGDVIGSYEGLAFKGSTQIAGKNFEAFFNAALNDSETDKISFPDEYKRFRGRANIYYNPSVLQISETALRIEDKQLIGTLVRQPITTIARGDSSQLYAANRFEGAFRLNNINLDDFNLFHSAAAVNDTDADELPASDSSSLKMLIDDVKQFTQKLGHNQVKLKINFADVTLNENQIDTAEMQLVLNQQLFKIEEIDLAYGGSLIQGSIALENKPNMLPKIQLNIRADAFDSAKFFGQDERDNAPLWRDDNGQWSTEEFDLLGLNDINVQATIDIQKYTHKEYNFNNLSTEFLLENNELFISKFNAQLWGGDLASTARMSIAKLPTFQADFALSNFQFSDLHNLTDLFSGISGSGNLRGNFKSSGVNPISAIQNMEGVISLAASGLKVEGFNLENLVRAANAVRKVQDIDKLIEYADRGGETAISTLQGSLNINDGFVRTPSLNIATPVGQGVIKGQISLLDWKLNMAVSILLNALDTQNPPEIRMLFVGPLNEATRSLDTQSLESFIAKQSAERLLVNP